MLSRFVRFKERDGMVVIFHDLHPVPIYCSIDLWHAISSNEDTQTIEAKTTIMELKKQKLIIDNSDEDVVEYQNALRKIEYKFRQPLILYLMTAQGCNISCEYCPVPDIAKKYGASLLSIEDAKAGIDLWSNHLRDSFDNTLEYSIIFYGGEPLLNKKTIKASLEYVETLIKSGSLPKINKMIVTNALLLDLKTISLFRNHEVSVVVGIDGPRNMHNLFRVDKDGQGTFDQVIKSIKLLVDNNIRTFASVSITPENIDYIESYWRFFKDLGIEKFGFNFVRGKNLLKMVSKDELPEFYKKVAHGIINSFLLHKEEHFEYQIEKKIQAFYQGDYFPLDCTCYGNQLVIQPDGQISNCPFRKTMMGQVRSVAGNFRIYNHDFIKYLKQRLPLYNKGLDDIEEKTLYGGGCSWACEEMLGDPLAIDEFSLTFSKEVFNEFLWTQYKK